jgi:hypothetical protein
MEKPRAVTADTAIRLARYFGATPEFWRGGAPPHPAPSPVTGERWKIGAAIERYVQPRAGLAA